MPRNLSPAVQSAIASKTVTLAMFAKVAFTDNTLYLWSGVGSFTPSGPPWSASSSFPYGQTFTGLGWLGKSSSIPQTTKLQAHNVTLALSGIPASLVSEAIGQVRMTGQVSLWYAFFDASGNLLKDPVQCFVGSTDVPSLTDDGASSTLSISCENTLLSLNLAPNRRFDDADQQLRSPGDFGFSFVQALANMQLSWPTSGANTTPYQTSLVLSPNPAKMAVGGTVQLTFTANYSDGSHQTGNAGQPSGGAHLATTNPQIATVDNNGLITGVSPGVCLVVQRAVIGLGPSGFANYRAACVVIVH